MSEESNNANDPNFSFAHLQSNSLVHLLDSTRLSLSLYLLELILKLNFLSVGWFSPSELEKMVLFLFPYQVGVNTQNGERIISSRALLLYLSA